MNIHRGDRTSRRPRTGSGPAYRPPWAGRRLAALFVLALLAAAAWALLAGPAQAQDPQQDLIEVTVSFHNGDAPHTAALEGSTIEIFIELSQPPGRELVIPLTATPLAGASADDYDVPLSVTFGPDHDRASVEFEATADDDDDGEFVWLRFGATLPPGVSLTTDQLLSSTIVEIFDGGRVTQGLAQVGVAVTAHVLNITSEFLRQES